MSSFKVLILAVSLLGLAPGWGTAWNLDAVPLPQQDHPYASGYAGSLPSDRSLRTGTYFDNPKIRALVQEMEEGPVARQTVLEALAGLDFTPEDLLRVKLLREEDGMYYIAFNYFTREDMKRVYEAAEARVPSLIQAYLDRREDFDRVFGRYPVASVPKDVLAFVMVAGFGLNWEGLEITEQGGWRTPGTVEGRTESGDRWRYGFWVSELVPDRSTRSFFWGSSTFPGGVYNYAEDPVDFSFSSFGDPYSDPRMSFPDLFGTPGEAMPDPVRRIAARLGLADRDEVGIQLRNALGFELGRSVGAVLFALRERPRTLDELWPAVRPEDRPRLPDLMDLLEETQYVERQGERYHLFFPVLEQEDRWMVQEALALNREVLVGWLEEHYEGIRGDLEGLTALEHGVPFESLFTQIWHDFFGLTTRELVQAGFLADPYDPVFRYQGSLPVLWRMSLYDFTIG